MAQPSCDRHKNLQMIPSSLESSGGAVSGHGCPVPGCGRHHAEDGYFDLADGKPVREEKRLKEKITLAADEILRMLRAKAGT